MKQLKLAQLDKVLYKWCTIMCSEGKLVTRSVIIEKANSFYNKIVWRVPGPMSAKLKQFYYIPSTIPQCTLHVLLTLLPQKLLQKQRL